MTQASRDQNFIPTALGVSSVDSVTPTPFQVDPVTGRLLTDVAGGGGYTNLTQFVSQTPWRIFYSDGSGDVIELALGANGTVLTSAGTASVPTWVASSSGGLTWSEVTGTSQAAAVDYGYICNNAGLVTVTLPDTAALGSVIKIVGKGAGGWLLAQNASENINFGNITTTTGVGGSLASSHRYDCIEIVCTVANTTWTVLSSQGNITYV
jgi:hypothetical protein